MKLPYSLDFIISCLIIASLCLFLIPPTESAPQFFNYTENPSETSFPNSVPRVTDLEDYGDGTVLVRIVRRNTSSTPLPGHVCVEQLLALRIINLNGTLTEININSTYLGLDSINYCLFTISDGTYKNPIEIFPLQNQFILVCYVNTTGSSDVNSYQDWGMIMDWSGQIYSRTYFGPSQVVSGTWIPNYSITPNINVEKGFLRLATTNPNTAEWQQYFVSDSGQFSLLSNDYITSPSFSSFIISTIAIVDEGYVIAFANSSVTNSTTNNTTNTNLFSTFGGIYANFLSYNQTTTGTPYILYQTPLSNITFPSLSCDVSVLGVGQTCSFSAIQGGINPYYLKVSFLSSGSLTSFTSIQNPANVNVSSTGLNIAEMPYGGYTLSGIVILNQTSGLLGYYLYAYDENNTPLTLDGLTPPIPANAFGVSRILKNNTFVLAQLESGNTWSLLTYQLPRVAGNFDHGYGGNFQVNTTNPNIGASISQYATNITITFYSPVDLSDGNITIYQVINSTSTNLRQTIPGSNTAYCRVSSDGLTVIVNVITSTFNQPEQQYYVEMDNNFVKSASLQEPLLGIGSRVWMITSDNDKTTATSTAVTGVLRLTSDASTKFQAFSKSQRSSYFSSLLQEISEKVPVRLSRLSSSQKYQIVNSGTPSQQVLISISISVPNKGEEGVPSVISDLNAMIVNKQITSISSGVTNDLDPTSGFVASPDLWERYRLKLIGVFVAITIFIVLFMVAQRRDPKAKNLAVLQLGLIIINFILQIIFVSSNAKDIQQLFLPSILFLVIPLAVNTILAFYIISKENSGTTGGEYVEGRPQLQPEFYDWYRNNGKVVSVFTVIAAADIEALMILESRLAGLDFFSATFSPSAELLVFWGACINIIIRNIPQVIIQVIYYTYIVTYDIVPLLLLITSCLTLLVNIVGRVHQAMYHLNFNRRESTYTLPSDDTPENFGGLHPLQIPPAMLNASNPISPDTPTKKGFLARRSGGKRNSRSSKRMSEIIADDESTNTEKLKVEELTDVELRNSEGNDDGTLNGDISNTQHSQSMLPQEQFDGRDNFVKNGEHSEFDNSGSVSTKRSSFEEVRRQ